MTSTLAGRAFAALLAALFACHAGAAAPSEVLVRAPEAVLTRADWDAELTRIPSEQRVAFVTSPQRVQATLNNLLVNRTLAERARAQGMDKDPIVQRRLALEADRALAALMVERIENEAGAEFDRAVERNVARARELYLIDRAKYATPEEIDVSHILLDSSKRGKEAALAAAIDVRAKLLAGADIAVLAVAVSDDPSAARNKGRLGPGPRGRYDPAFEAAAFALKSPGDLSAPVLTRFGYHVIRLEGRKPESQQTFDEVRGQILVDMRQKHVSDARESTIAAIRGDSRLQVNREAVDALVVKVDIPPSPPSLLDPATPANPRLK
jgi:peptidyl-prolyl cis-trans isomerase C